MKKFSIIILFAAATMLSSCYSYTSVVGTGAKENREVTKWNHYVIGGLAPVSVSDSKAMAGDSENYTVNTRITFVSGLCCILTGGIYTPTVTTVKK